MKKHGKWAIIMAHKVIILYRLYMPYYFLGTFTEYPYNSENCNGEEGDNSIENITRITRTFDGL